MLIAPGSKLQPRRPAKHERPAPIKGIDLSTNMMTRRGDAGHAQRLDNWICRTDGLHVRPGYNVIETLSETAPVKSLLYYPGHVFGRIDGEWHGAVLPNEGRRFLFATSAIGALPIIYDGSQWSLPTLNSVDATKLRCATRHCRRLYFIEAGTLDLLYLDRDAVSGAVSRLLLRGIFEHGGELRAIASLSGDGGKDSQDVLLAVTTNGELAVFVGNDPNNPETWALKSVHMVPKPLGTKCFYKTGPGLWYLSVDGLFSIPDILAMRESQKDAASVSDPVKPLMPLGANASVIESGAIGATVVHSDGFQLVRDPSTGGWSRFTGLNASCWLETPDGLFFGSNTGHVCRMIGGADHGGLAQNLERPITTIMVDAFAKYGTQQYKHFNRIRPIWRIAQPYHARMEFLTEYRDLPDAWDSANIDSACWSWDDVQAWNFARQGPMPWTRDISARLGQWRGIAGRGSVAALMIGAKFHGVPAIYTGHEAMFELGGNT